ncbi:hypothetical protein FF011L_10320 [Roseimaritima multifibrata]|uniref:Uncharacterized protein n=1 Tax=Roseimaritima multifibrata TaxID=1930274 RepID=A0A517MBM8_9BACT|nr:hypothetical protein [Roseimaritima multifibrata]QDS92290.1 hypothetical protein FF011L_10320 [Roseimaritima multifibrata]
MVSQPSETSDRPPQGSPLSSLPEAANRRPQARRPQVSIAIMLLMMTIICTMSAAMFYASRVPAIRNEVLGWFGKEVASGETSRTLHLTFLLFTYSAPLLLAGLLGIGVSLVRWIQPAGMSDDDEQPATSPWDD